MRQKLPINGQLFREFCKKIFVHTGSGQESDKLEFAGVPKASPV